MTYRVSEQIRWSKINLGGSIDAVHFESGKVMLPSNAPWLDDYRRELTAFPGSKHDDQIDSTTQALHYISSNTTAEIWAKMAQL